MPYCGSLVLFGGLQNKLFEKNDLFVYSEQGRKWVLCEVESITRQEVESGETGARKPRDVSRILINNNNFSIFSKHIKNSLSLSPLKKNHSLSFERREEKQNSRQFLSPEFSERNRNRSAFALGARNNIENSPSKRNLESNKLNPGFP